MFRESKKNCMIDLHIHSSLFQAVHSPAQRLCASVMACFAPVFAPVTFKHRISPPAALQVCCSKWGDLGHLVCEDFPSRNSQLHFEPPQSISPDDLPRYEKLIREECLGSRGRLAELFGQKDIVDQTLSQALYEKRMQRQQEFKIWLSSRLQIFGYRDLYLDPVLNTSNKIDEKFDFPIKGTPAQFGVMLRQFAQTLHAQTQCQQLASQILLPGSRKDACSIPPDANPVEVKLTFAKNQLTIHAHVLPSDRTLLRVHLNGDKNLWGLWDRIRDELEKLGWFALPEIPELPASVETEPVSQQQITNPAAEIWMRIPDIGANREILRHWHKGLTCDQIAVRVSLSAKTILNRINKLRKEYGAEIVPYRKSNFIKDPRKKPS